MTSSVSVHQPAPQVHPILTFTHALSRALDRVLAVTPVHLAPSEQAQALLALDTQRTRREALELRVLAAADRNGVGTESGAPSTAAWLAHHTVSDRPGVATTVKLARALDDDLHATAAGLAAGEMSAAHARVVVNALGDLPRDLDPGILGRAEKTLVDEARHLTPTQLRTVGRHLLEVVAPEVVEAAERHRLDRQDAAAYASARLSMRPLGDGTTQGWFRLPDLHARLLKTAVEAVIAPRKSEQPEPGPVTGRVPDHATRMGRGLCEVLEHVPTDGYGVHGGLAATLLLTLDHQTLTAGLGAAALVDGTEVSPGETRRLACGAGIIPAVLGGPSAVLDLGRERRLFNRAQRVALALRDKGCRAEGCDRPPSWCEAHHLTSPWAAGGQTNLADGILLCGHHPPSGPPPRLRAPAPSQWRPALPPAHVRRPLLRPQPATTWSGLSPPGYGAGITTSERGQMSDKDETETETSSSGSGSGGSILDNGGIDTDERAGRSLGIDPRKEPDDETRQKLEEERQQRLDPENRPDAAEVDNTERTFDHDRGQFTDAEDYDQDAPPRFSDPEDPNNPDNQKAAGADG